MGNELYEYTVDKKPEGAYRLKRLLMIALYVAFFVGLFVVVMIIKIYPTFAIAPILTYILVLCTWRYVSIEYRYEVEHGELRLMTVYGGKKKKLNDTLIIKSASAILPYEKATDAIAAFSASVTYDLLSSHVSPKDPYAIMLERDRKRILVLLEMPEPSKKAVLYYATDAVREMAKL